MLVLLKPLPSLPSAPRSPSHLHACFHLSVRFFPPTCTLLSTPHLCSYSLGDKVERWLNDLLCLDAAEHTPPPPARLPHPGVFTPLARLGL